MSEPRDLMRKYLEQREALGEGPVVLGYGVGERKTTEERCHRGTERRQVREVTEETKYFATEMNSAQAAPTSHSARATAPGSVPIPRGIVIQPPSTDLFTGDDRGVWASLSEINDVVRECERCRLCRSRTNTVPGEGPADAKMVVVGEGPGAREDETGRPFVGRAGELLTDILKAISLARDAVFICNIVKCRPPSNRTPQQDEIEACVPYLHRQLEIVRPDVILAMGSTAITTLLQRKQPLGAFRGKVHCFRGMPLVATYHPAALLRNPNWKRPTWDDVRIARQLLDE